ncbi:hypothetical protein CYY_000424 [Polysphondylium violaceum]|uniref:N-acetyltransferase domain-containing protein n=1 Tax=Polysphondylium violaceum TaxID=133409 RepID=A0A8J4Q4S0_9MYCE|nr:hypothetical protein CYY_000424 [Polysphondylium violaceum]
MIPSTNIESETQPFVLVQSTAEEYRINTFDNHLEWGGNLTQQQYYDKGMAGNDVHGGHRGWHLKSSTSGEIVASCETFTQDAMYCMGGSAEIKVGKCDSVASVYVQPKYRGKGYATMMMKALNSVSRSQGTLYIDLYSDVDPKVYEKCGWNQIETPTLKLDTTQELGFTPVDTTGSNITIITNANIQSVIDKDHNNCVADLKKVASESDPSTYIFSTLFTLEKFFWFTIQHRLSYEFQNLEAPTEYGRFLNDSYIIWSHNCRDNQLEILKFHSTNLDEFKILLQSAYNEAKKHDLKTVYMWWSTNRIGHVVQFLESTKYQIEIRKNSIPMVTAFPPSGIESTNYKWISCEKFQWV